MTAPSHRLARIGIALALSCGALSADSPAPKDASPLVVTDLTGREHRLFASNKTRGAVVVFISTDCPIANTYQPVLRRLASRYREKGISFFLVHCDPDVTTEAARRHAREFELSSPVVLDRKQALVRRLQARITPEAFVLTPDGRTAYRGRIDNLYETWGKKRPEATVHDLADALDAVLAGQPVKVPETTAVGCEIFLEEGQ